MMFYIFLKLIGLFINLVYKKNGSDYIPVLIG